jgi:O-antigen/teichoic acid export membrane protein
VAVGLLGPLILVRLLTLEQYGGYRDFLLYVALLQPWVQLNINSSLSYFVAREPENERIYLSQASFFVLVSSVIVTLLLLSFARYLPDQTVQAYTIPLCLYLIVVNNLDGWEVYWLAQRKTMAVLFYSIARLGIRMVIVVSAAYVSRNVEVIVWSLVVFEALRLLASGLYGLKNRLFTRHFRRESLKSQLDFVVPLAVALVVFSMNTYIGQFFVSIWLGVTALAIYSVGAYMYPFVRIFRDSLSDVIMPEIVSRRDIPANEALQLWQRSTVAYCALMLPLAVLLFYYAETVVTTLFTASYAAAVPVFQILTFVLVRLCFDFGLPLRVVKQTRAFLINSVLILGVNIAVLLLLFDSLGILAPAVATIASGVFGAINMAWYVIRHCGFTLRNLLPWVQIGKVALSTAVSMPVLLFGEIPSMPAVPRAIIFGVLYLSVYAVLLKFCGIPEINRVVQRLRSARRLP